MAHDTDFLDLYNILGLTPDCDLAEFKRAYRRRVAVLHPDRGGGNPDSPVAVNRLQQLTAMYGMAMEFQREHGRLPGAPRARVNARAPAPPAARQPVVRPRSRRPLRWLFVPAVVIVVWLLWPGDHQPVNSPSSTQLAPPASGQSQTTTAVTNLPLSLGMDMTTVRANEGEPTLMINNGRWEYGPSWIRFEHGKVVDWYSSPLYPLQTARRSPSTRKN